MTLTESNTSTTHPLDPLTAEEISRAAAIFRSAHPNATGSRFISIERQEPSRAELRSHEVGVEPDRRAFIVIRDVDQFKTFEVVVFGRGVR